MGTDYVRLCPACGVENATDVMRCACGAMLFGIDLTRQGVATSTGAGTISEALLPETAVCPHEDCGQNNPVGSDTCLYCNRRLATGAALTPAGQCLLNLPVALRDRYRIVNPFPAAGAEADILLVEALSGGPQRVAKIYRQGMQPKAGVQERITRIDTRHRVEVFESGVSDGYAYEVMEFCAYGSLADRMRHGPLAANAMADIVRQLAAAIAAVHATGLLHRDLKPENVLVRSEAPLDLALTDFSIASVIDSTQRFTSAARTLPYASPESLSGVIDGKADYWSLGMLLLEAALGGHPFAGLSEAVILHHLTTRSMDIDGIRDLNLRKLLRGLLLRDPKQRWGNAEVERWLAGDPVLAEPVERGPGGGFAKPYHLGNDICFTAEQLAIALARNWRAGIADLGNSQLQAWFRDVQKDQNTVRLLLAMQYEQHLHLDVQLLRLILHLAPGLPPVWRGESIELRAVLTRANLALKGDAVAARWLDAIYQHRVLAIYASAGNPEMIELAQRWTEAVDRFLAAWKTQAALLKARRPPRDPSEVANYDEMVFGSSEPESPALLVLHPRLLATAFDARWSERLRQRVQAEFAELLVHCPWLADLGDPQQMDPAGLLVAESLLPAARKAEQRQVQAVARQRESADETLRSVRQDVTASLARLRGNAQGASFMPAVCDLVRADIDNYLDVLARLRSSGRSDEPWMDLRKSAARSEAIANRMLKLLDDLSERRAANAGWISLRMLGFQLLALILLPELLGERSVPFLLAMLAGILAWRFLPVLVMMRKLREMASRL